MRILLFGLVFLLSCSPVKKNSDGSISGTWIPENIKWKSADENDPELKRIKFSSFLTFSFKTPSDFIIVGSTNSPGDHDSILLATEPGYNISRGKWQPDKNTNTILIKYKKKFFEFTPPGAIELKEYTDTISFENGYLLYNNIKYKRFDQINNKRIEEFWKASEVMLR